MSAFLPLRRAHGDTEQTTRINVHPMPAAGSRPLTHTYSSWKKLTKQGLTERAHTAAVTGNKAGTYDMHYLIMAVASEKLL